MKISFLPHKPMSTWLYPIADQNKLSVEATLVGAVLHYELRTRQGSFVTYAEGIISREDLAALDLYRKTKGLSPVSRWGRND